MLTFELGGAMGIAALVQNGALLDRRRLLLRRGQSAAAWLEAAADIGQTWRGRFRRAAFVTHGEGGHGEVATQLAARLAVPVTSLPVAQAAAWAEHRFGTAGRGEMVFVWAGQSLGGAIVNDGRLWRGTHGLAGRLGDMRRAGGPGTISDVASGAALLRQAAGQSVHDLAGLLEASAAGTGWASRLLDQAACELATAIAAIQALLDPPQIMLGGPIGAAPGFVDRLRGWTAEQTPRPSLAAASLGSAGAMIGAADHATATEGVLALTAS